MAASIGDIYEAQVIYNSPWGVLQNNFGFVAIASVAGDAQADLANAFKTALVKNTSGGLLYPVVDDVYCAEVDVEDVKPGTLATYLLTFSAIAGYLSADPLPPQTSAVLSHRTALKGRSYRGRTYLPPASEDFQAGGTWTGTAITAFSTVATQLLAVFGPSGSNTNWRFAVISRYLNGVLRAAPIATQVTSISVDTRVLSQRRRVLGVGS